MKTLADHPRADTVPHLAVPATVAGLWPLAPGRPLGQTARRLAPTEQTLYRLTATLVSARHVDDHPDAGGEHGGDLDLYPATASPTRAEQPVGCT